MALPLAPHPIYLFNDCRCRVTITAPSLTFFPDHLPPSPPPIFHLPSLIPGSHVSSLQWSISDSFSTFIPIHYSDQLSNLLSLFRLSISNSLHSFRIPNEVPVRFISFLSTKNLSRWYYCFLTTSPTQPGSTLPHLNWSENIYRQRLWSTHCHKVSQSFSKLIGAFVFLFSCQTQNSDFI